MYNVKFSVEFNNVVENVKLIVRESRHMNINPYVYQWLKGNVCAFLDDVNMAMEFKADSEAYVMNNLLDLLDSLKNVIDDEHCVEGTNDYRVLNSVYDCIKEFYFDD